MEVKAYAKSIHMSARKVRLVADMIRGKKATEAATLLKFVKRAAAEPMFKVLKSAMANAEHNAKLDSESLWIKSVLVDNAGFLKRSRPRAMGRTGTIHKHLAHITLVVSDTK